MADLRLTLDGKSHQVTRTGATVLVDGEPFEFDAEVEGGTVRVRLDGKPFTVELSATAGTRLTALVNGRQYAVDLERHTVRPRPTASVPAPRDDVGLPGSVLAPMAGRISHLLVRLGDAVEAGDLLMTLEAMKMENEIRAPRSGRVQQVAVVEGQRVTQGAPLLTVG